MLQTSIIVFSSLLAAFAPTYAAPAQYPPPSYSSQSSPSSTAFTDGSDPNTPRNFYLVTSTSSASASNSSLLPNVTALSLFDPFNQPNYWLRAIDKGYNSLPTFNLTDGTLATLSSGPHNFGSFVYNSTISMTGMELEFYAEAAPQEGSLGIVDGHLLAVAGETKGWQLCIKADNSYLGQTVLNWKSNNPNCTDIYVQTVANVPY